MFNLFHKKTQRLYSIFALFLLLLQNFAPLTLLFTPTTAVASEVATQSVSVTAPTLDFNTTTNELVFAGQAENNFGYVLQYAEAEGVDTLQQAVSGLAKVESGKFSEKIYLGTCSGEVCVPGKMTSGQVIIAAAGLTIDFKMVGETLWSTVDGVSSVAKVKLGQTYVYPGNDGVKVKFTTLPAEAGSLSIKEITLNEEQIKATGALSPLAYDVTSSMENGSFAYDLSLPLPEGSSKDVDLVYAEDVAGLVEATEIKTVITGDEVKATGLDHFTVFVVVYPSQMATTDRVDVYLNHMDSWFFYNDENDTIDNSLGSFVSGPAVAPYGAGSVQISVSGTQRRNLATYKFSGTPLADITELGFSTYNPSLGNGGPANRTAYLNFNVDFNGTDTWQRRLIFSPPAGEILQNTWQAWDAIRGGNAIWHYSGATWPGTGVSGTVGKTWNQIKSEYPGVRVRVTDSWMGIRVGSPYESGYTENIDAFVFGTAAGTTVYNFDPEPNNPPVVTIENPSPLANSYVRGTVTGRAIATDDFGMGGSYLRFWQNGFETGTLRANCQVAPGGNLLGTSEDATCVLNSTSFPDGPYVFSAQFIDDKNQWGMAQRAFTVDNTAPIAAVTNPAAGSYVQNPITISGTASDALAGIKSVALHIYRINSDTTKALVPGCTSLPGTVVGNNWSLSVNNGGSCNLVDGSYEIAAWAYDNANNPGWAPRIQFYVDNTAPSTPTLLSPADGITRVTSNFNYSDWSDVTDGAGVTYRYQSSPTTDFSTLYYDSNNYGPGLINSMIMNPGEPEVTYYWRVQACDSLGHCSAWTNPWRINIDNTAPTAPTGGTPHGTVIPTNNFDFDWNDVVDASALTYEFQSTMNPAATGGVLTTGLWHSPNPLLTSDIHSSGAPNGTWYWQVRAIDAAGNVGPWSSIWNVTLDTVAPVGTVSYSPTTLTNGDVLATLSVSEPVTITSVGGNTHTFTANGSFTFTFEDAAGNTGSAVATVNYIDKEAPVAPTLVGPVNNSYNNSGTVTNSWQPIADAAYYIYESYHNAEATNLRWNQTITAPTTSKTATGIADAKFWWRVKAVDAAGNVGPWSELWNVTVDRTKPTLLGVSSDAQVYNLASTDPEIKLTFSENLMTAPTVVVTPTSGVQTINNCGDADSKTFCFTFGLDLEEMTHSLQISGAADLAGNVMVANSSHSFIVDRLAPRQISSTIFSGWYNSNRTAVFSYEDGNAIVSGNNPSCEITTEGASETCTLAEPNVCDVYGNCNTTAYESNAAMIDKTDPESVITFPINSGSDSTVYTNDWTGSIMGTASDNLSGVASVAVSIRNIAGQYYDGTNFVDSEGEILLPATLGESGWEYNGLTAPFEGSYTIKSHATDVATNVENTYTVTVIFDKTIPQVALSINPVNPDASNGWYKTQPEITLTATDANIDRIEYQWNLTTGVWTLYTAAFKPAAEGANILYYRAHDLAGNYSEIGIKNVKWDKTELSEGPLNLSVSPNPTAGTTAEVRWEEAKDNLGIERYEIKWSLQNGDKSYNKTVGGDIRKYTIDNLIQGTWNVEVRAVDGAGNSKTAGVNLVVDREGPVAPTLNILGSSTGSVTLGWNAIADATDYIIWYGTTPGVSQFGARVGNVTTYTVGGLSAGSYYFTVKAVDAAGNQGANSNEVSTGAIAGAPGAIAGEPAIGFGPEVRGATTEATDSGEVVELDNPEVLGDSTTAWSWLNWLWWLLLIPLLFILRYFYKKIRD